MTDKLHCPFCGTELLGSLNEKYCTNRECEHYMRTIPTSIWQALIDGKKTQDALKIAMEAIDILYDAIRHNNAKETCHIADYVLKFVSEQRKILNEITSITKQENE